MQRTNFCGSGDDGTPRPISEFIYNLVMAFVLVYDIVDLKDGPTRLKHLAYYVIVAIENGALLGIWFTYSSGQVQQLRIPT